MRTTIHLSDQLLRQVLQETKAKTMTQAIRDAVEGFLAHCKRVKLIKSFGRFPKWNPDIRAMRRKMEPLLKRFEHN